MRRPAQVPRTFADKGNRNRHQDGAAAQVNAMDGSMNTIQNTSAWNPAASRPQTPAANPFAPAEKLFNVQLLPTGSLFDSVGVVLDLSSFARQTAQNNTVQNTAPAPQPASPVATGAAYTAQGAPVQSKNAFDAFSPAMSINLLA